MNTFGGWRTARVHTNTGRWNATVAAGIWGTGMAKDASWWLALTCVRKVIHFLSASLAIRPSHSFGQRDPVKISLFMWDGVAPPCSHWPTNWGPICAIYSLGSLQKAFLMGMIPVCKGSPFVRPGEGAQASHVFVIVAAAYVFHTAPPPPQQCPKFPLKTYIQIID